MNRLQMTSGFIWLYSFFLPISSLWTSLGLFSWQEGLPHGGQSHQHYLRLPHGRGTVLQHLSHPSCACTGPMGTTAFVLVTEPVGPSRRAAAGMSVFYFFSAGIVVLATIAYFFPSSWRTPLSHHHPSHPLLHCCRPSFQLRVPSLVPHSPQT